jgi:ABC-2 type transport system permease protein
MSEHYSQFKAMLAISKASLKSTFKSPQATFFSLFFPIVLIAIFGAIGGNSSASVDIAFSKDCDTTNILYQQMKKIPIYKIDKGTQTEIDDKLKKGRITAIVNIQKITGDASHQYNLHLITSSASQRELPLLQSIIRDMVRNIDEQMLGKRQSYAEITKEEVPGREYKLIDFFLPGMIGFSLIGASVFGVAFLFYSLRDTLVLKRMYSSPIKKAYIVLGESLSRVVFQLCTVVVLVLFGRFFYNFTLANGWVTFVDMMIISFFALLVFMGFGFFVSGIAKNQSVIPIYANLFMFPQYFLSGTFFSRSALPQGLQPFIKFLPLTALNDAMRNVAFEGAGILDCWKELSILAVWGILVYALVTKTFKWE